MKRTLLAAAALTALSLTLASCAGASDPSSTDEKQTTVTLGLASAPISLDPSKAATGLYVNYVDPAYASLLDRSVDGEIVAGLADEWGYVGEGNTEFHVTLRDGVLWADGTEITAEQVVASLEYFKTGSGPSAPYLAEMSFAAVDERTVAITTPTANPMIPDLLTPEYLAGAVISPAGLENPEGLAEATYGAGPYVYDAADSVSGDTYVFVPNENYYDQDAINWEQITIRVVANTNSAVEALKSGQLDFISGTPDSAKAIEGTDGIVVDSAPALWAGLYILDRNGEVVPALADERVRQALNYAVDREAIADAVYGEFGGALGQPAVPGFDGYSESANSFYEYDPEKAKSLLAEAGFADGFTIPVNYGSFDQENTKVVQAVQSQLAEVGVTLELKAAANFGGWVDDLVSKKHAMTLLSPGAGGAQYFITQSTFLPGGILNIFGAEDAELTAAYGELIIASTEERAAAAQKISEIAAEHALSLPISSASTIVIYDDALSGVEFTKGVAIPTYVTDWTVD